MGYNVVYLVKIYNIYATPMVKNDQTRLHLVPTTRERRWARKGAKHIKVIGIENKGQVTFIVSSFGNGLFLPLQVVFMGTTHKTLPPNNEGKFMCINNGWDFTFSKNNWSTIETTKKIVHKILLLYLHSQIEQLSLLEHQKNGMGVGLLVYT
jgi:hypothetical protein